MERPIYHHHVASDNEFDPHYQWLLYTEANEDIQSGRIGDRPFLAGNI